MKPKQLRFIIPLIVMVVVGIGFAANQGIGTLSAIGWQDVSLLCPLGALGTMLATKTLIPQAVISLIFAIIAIVILARGFCGWVCPVPVVSKLREWFTGKPSNADLTGEAVLAPADNPLLKNAEGAAGAGGAAGADAAGAAGATADLAPGCGSCKSCKPSMDSRHVILGGSLLSAAIFGFPVFCLVCPIGLSFATIVLLIRLFTFGDVTWSIILVPLILLAEVVFFRKWCSTLCPLGAFMSIFGKANKTFVPTIDNSKCRESAEAVSCEACAAVCPQGINPRHLEAGYGFNECSKCMACLEACPTKAITMPLIPKGCKDVQKK